MTHDHIECDQSQIGLSSVLICSLGMSREIPRVNAERASIIVFDINALVVAMDTSASSSTY